jgi:hypothetical protein
MTPEPAHEVEHIGISPHPGGEPLEIGERVDGIHVGSDAAHVAIHAIGIGPVGFDGHRRETSVGDQALGDRRPLPIELVRAVRRLAEKDDLGLADAVEQRVVIADRTGERDDVRPKSIGGRLRDARIVARRRRPVFRQRRAHLFIRGLSEVVVPQADGLESGWCRQTDDLVGDATQTFARLPGANRHRDDDSCGPQLPQREDRGFHRRARGQPIVNEDDLAPGDVHARPPGAVLTITPLELGSLVRDRALEGGGGNPEIPHQGLVEHADAAFGQRAHGQLFVAGHAELTDQKNVEGDSQR